MAAAASISDLRVHTMQVANTTKSRLDTYSYRQQKALVKEDKNEPSRLTDLGQESFKTNHPIKQTIGSLCEVCRHGVHQLKQIYFLLL